MNRSDISGSCGTSRYCQLLFMDVPHLRLVFLYFLDNILYKHTKKMSVMICLVYLQEILYILFIVSSVDSCIFPNLALAT